MSDYHYLIAGYGDGKTRAADYDTSEDAKDVAIERRRENRPLDDGYEELAAYWPDLNDLPDGRDIYEGVFPVSGGAEAGKETPRL